MKRDHLKRNKLCFFCFSGRHSIAFCPKLKKEKGCSFCGLKSHSKTLCYRFHQNNSDKTTSNSRKEESDDSVASVSSCQTETKTQRVLLQTASVVARYNKQFRNCRLLAATAAQRSFVERKFSRLLKLPVIRKEKLSVYSFGDTSPVEKTFNVVKIRLENKDDPNSYLEIEALETEKISAAHIPPPDIDISIYSKHLKGLKLADTTNNDANVSVLIGADNYYDVMTGRIKRISRKLVAAESLYGWCLIGISGPPNKNSSDSFAMKVVVEEDISKQLEAFWQLENLGIEKVNENLNCKDNKILQQPEENIQFRDGRYVVKLPWKDNLKESLDNNYEIAHERFSKLCHKFKSDQSLYTEYKNVIDSYVEQNIVERVPNSNVVGGAEFYLPHRAVIRHDRVSSKLRIVFDASSHKRGKFSLNDSLHIDPNLYPDLFELLLSFRKHPIAFTVDIKQAFLNVELDYSDKNVTKFFWTDNPESFSESLEVLRFNSVLFGINSSPFLLTATIKYHLKKYSSLFPQTHELLNKFVYVDDVLGGQSTVASAYTTSVECVQIFSEANMPLHKWATNSAELRELWEKNGFSIETSSNSIGQNMINYKVLGISWDTERDIFYFDIENLLSFISKGTDTKRFLLQVAGRIFDPLGLIAPYVIRLKVLIQNVWEMGLLWDQKMPQIVKKPFKEWCHELKDLHLESIPRFYDFTDSNVVDVQLHSFSDSSKKAYGTVIYFRVVRTDGTISTSFVTSKSRVAPLKTLSLPRLELMGALLSARLCDKVSKTLKFEKSCFFHTDSFIVYHWIQGEPFRFKPFVKNRIEEIQKLTEPSKWHHCPGKENPADILSRGSSVRELKDSELWWHGPPWLKQTEQFWPKIEKQNVSSLNLELKSKSRDISQNEVILENCEKLLNIAKFSSYLKLLRVTAFVFRYIYNTRNTLKKRGAVNTEELKKSEEYWIKEIQKETYGSEIIDLEKTQKVSDCSKIRSLVPYLDDRQILRIKGRLDESELSLDEKQPILLPQNSKFMELLILREHTKNFHSRVTTTL
ncbi:integrase catalytic domain-containing protein, partial [Nephila pilipes]